MSTTTQQAINQALNQAVSEIKTSPRPSAPLPSKDPADSPTAVAGKYGWPVADRDKAIQMYIGKKTLSEIREAINHPAEEIDEMLGLHRLPGAGSRKQVPPVLADRVIALQKKGFQLHIIAEILNADGFCTTHGNPWDKTRVAGLMNRMKKLGVA